MKRIHRLFQLGAFVTTLAFSANLEAAKPGGGGGGGKTEIRFARILIDPSSAVRSDGEYACGSWDYGDHRDTGLGCAGGGGSTADVSGGGRLHFNTINLQGTDGPLSSLRWLVLNFNHPGNPVWGAADPKIDELYEGGPTDPPVDLTPGIDNVKTIVSLDNMFKDGATQNPLVITIRNCDDPSQCYAVPTGYSPKWVDDLNIEDAAPGVRVLTTEGTSALADLLWDHDGKPKTPPIHVGRYIMPIHWTMRLTAAP